ncbi:SDR family NAD(P)-dependent oxidoreductase [Sphingomonas sp. DG1-23]|uniref:SDR family NAD(P)-dependent oxidoreductase n=1 Tax=Sphingomonas sp. DG1-23 TaxID=3068316 RepID=UPI00273E164E|nr:SDR family NAD(P)-dependent oxidoreductase [Sphingomonas sp. DG1-23]MDP5280155.1 SDR family NAD(P)-dependent oxidoreductase [Sphingomonas sp. DG1-23]
MQNNFARRTILVTGAASGIGLAVAERLSAEGAKRLILMDRDREALERLTLPCDTTLVCGDVREEPLWDAVEPELGALDHAVINAGVASAGAIADMSFDAWRHILSVNLDGAFLTLRAAMRAMKGRGGSIVLTASAAGVKAEAGVAAYGASKAALIHLAKVAAKEGAPHGIRVNAIAPAGVETPVWDAIPMFAERAAEIGRDAAFAEMAAMATPLGRYAKPEEIAGQIGFLLSDQSALVTGATLISDGGYTL